MVGCRIAAVNNAATVAKTIRARSPASVKSVGGCAWATTAPQGAAPLKGAGGCAATIAKGLSVRRAAKGTAVDMAASERDVQR